VNLPASVAQRAAKVVSPKIPRGMDLLDTPLLNRGTAFSDTERTQFGLHGLLPPCVETLEEQVARAYEAYARKEDDLEWHIYLRALQDNNEVLFYRLLLEHIEQMTPIIYTPTLRWPVSNSVTFTAGRAACSLGIRSAIPLSNSCGTDRTRMWMSLS
jgi:Malic enzyme, N-terminal domain